LKDVHVEEIVGQLLIQSGSEVQVILESHFPGDRFAGGKYNFGTHTITLYIEEIKAQCLQIFSTLNCFADYLAVVFAHEIGHAEDSTLEELILQMDTSSHDEYKRKRIALEIEENAWAYARTLIPRKLHTFMDTIIQQSLQPYHDVLHV
jgi:hypothetical protein